MCSSDLALTFTAMEEIQRTRSGIPINSWRFGDEIVKTKVYVMVPRQVERVDVGLVQISSTPTPLPDDPYDVALMLRPSEPTTGLPGTPEEVR